MGDDTEPDDTNEPAPRRPYPSPYGAQFARSFGDLTGFGQFRQDIPDAMQPNLPDLSQVFAANHKHLLEQLQPKVGQHLQSMLSDAALRAWQSPQDRSRPRSTRTPRKLLTANATEVTTLSQFTSAVAQLSAKHSDHELVWRGQGNADWAVRSTLSRAVSPNGATEDELIEAETDIVNDALGWGLHPMDFPAAPLHVLAELQHGGAPTRLLDVTQVPEIAAWFAVENPALDEHDALLIAWGQHPRGKKGVAKNAQSTSELLNLDGGHQLPWREWDLEERRDRGWGTGERAHVWFPPHPSLRMRVQHGGFMIESGPIFTDPVRKAINTELTRTTEEDHDWRRSELERATSVIGLPSPIRRVTRATDTPLVPIFTIVIASEVKEAIRAHLATRGLEPKTMYPDLPGLVTNVRRNYPTG